MENYVALHLLEKMIFLREKGALKKPQKRTWEGILSSDSPERSICKTAGLDNYGVDAKDASGNDCDDRGWNICMQLMDLGQSRHPRFIIYCCVCNVIGEAMSRDSHTSHLARANHQYVM